MSKQHPMSFRINENLAKRFEWALKKEGLGKTQFFVAKIQEFCEQVERKHLKDEEGNKNEQTKTR